MTTKPTRIYSPPNLTVVGSVAGLAVTVMSFIFEGGAREPSADLLPGTAVSKSNLTLN